MQRNLFLQKVLFQTFETHATGVCTPMLPQAMTSYATAQYIYLESQQFRIDKIWLVIANK